jgi:hypothetical protein
MDQSTRQQWLGMYNRGSIDLGGYTTFLQSQAAWERSMASVNMLSSTISFLETLDKAYWEYIDASIRQKYREIFPFRLSSLVQAQREGMYGEYCVKPFIRKSALSGSGPGRWGFVIIDMQNGRWCEITRFFGLISFLSCSPQMAIC